MSPCEPVASDAEARALAARLGREPALAFDSEGDGMYRYRARLCLVQFASAHELAVVDSLAADPTLFAELLGERGPQKILHDAAFDARLLRAHGITLGNVFDTAVAARFLGFASTGLASLLAELLGVRVSKELQRADWGERPLPPEALRYLEDDVRYLLSLSETLLERVRAKDIEPEVREECAYVLHAAARSDEPSPFARLKGAAVRPPSERARLYELALAREALARELDQPPGRVVPNELLLRLAQLAPALDELERRLPAAVRTFAARFAEALARAEGCSDAPEHELAAASSSPAPSEVAKRKRRRELLSSFRAREAQERGVDVQVVLPGHCLSDLSELARLDANSLAHVPGLGAHRIERYAARWQGELGPRWNA